MLLHHVTDAVLGLKHLLCISWLQLEHYLGY